ncbi:DUF6941 family protein [Methylobacterium sp. HMF5984]|uniref:DUF6941 family protein n=1 Tax=Methylobacterium sp. HMF5984 TaxID=3367370 RepID=UPI003852C777
MLEGYVIYCDDIRVEDNGKLMLIGVYGTDLIAQGEFPITLTQIQLLIRFRYTLEHCGKSLNINVYLPGDDESTPSLVHGINTAQKPSASQLEGIKKAYADGPVFANLSIPLGLSHIQVDELGFIKVTLECEGEVKRLNSLRINDTPALNSSDAPKD